MAKFNYAYVKKSGEERSKTELNLVREKTSLQEKAYLL